MSLFENAPTYCTRCPNPPLLKWASVLLAKSSISNLILFSFCYDFFPKYMLLLPAFRGYASLIAPVSDALLPVGRDAMYLKRRNGHVMYGLSVGTYYQSKMYCPVMVA